MSEYVIIGTKFEVRDILHILYRIDMPDDFYIMPTFIS